MPKRDRPAEFAIRFRKDEHATNFDRLKSRMVLLSKFPHLPTLQRFHWDQGVRFLLRKGGLEGFLNKDAITYHKPTLEFLSSLERCTIRRHSGIKFQLGGTERRMTYGDVAEAFGWTLPEGNWEAPNELEVKNLWWSLTGKYYSGAVQNKLNSVRHPCFRYVFRLVITNILCQGEPGSVRTPQLTYFWPLCPEGTSVPNYVEIFVTRCLAQQQESDGKIGFGGMVTLLGEKLGYQFTEADIQIQPQSSTCYDPFSLRQAEFITYDNQPFSETHYLIARVKSVHLPPHPRTLFWIPPNVSTSRCRDVLGGDYVPLVEEENVEEEQEAEADDSDEDYAPFVDVAQQSMPHGEGSSSGPQQEQWDRIEGKIDSYHTRMDVMDTRWRDMEAWREAKDARDSAFQASVTSQFERLFTMFDSRLPPAPPLPQPGVMSPDEMRRQFEEQQRRHPGDYHGFPGSGPGPSSS